MSAFAALRALGWLRPDPPVVAVSVRLSDRTGDAVTRDLTLRGLLPRYGWSMSLDRDGSRLSIRLFLPEYSQGDREVGRGEAAQFRSALVETLGQERHVVTFNDLWFCERGTKGWNILVKAKGREV